MPLRVRTRAAKTALGVALASAVVLLIVALRSLGAERVAHGIAIAEVSLSGSNRKEVEAALFDLEKRLRSAPLSVSISGHALELRPERLGFRLSVAETAERAFAFAAERPLGARVRSWLARWFEPEEIGALVLVDREKLAAILDDWEKTAIVDRPFEGGIHVADGKLKLAPPHSGRRVDRERAERLLLSSLGSERRGTVNLPTVSFEPPIDASVWEHALERAELLTRSPVELTSSEFRESLRVTPETLRAALRVHKESAADPRAVAGSILVFEFAKELIEPELATLKKSLERPPEPARFEIDAKDKVSIVPSRAGTRLSVERVCTELLAAAESPERRGELPVERDAEPPFRTEDAERLHIARLTGKFTTHFACCQPRVRNIQRIADLVNHSLVKPGETLSLNAVVGERTVKNGFVAAPSIQDGEMVDTIGGGVSQFATTFFNAVFYAGYDILERQSHTYWFSRYPMGHEATLSWPKPDVVFKNDSEAGVLVETSYTDTSITVKLFGDNGGRTVKASVSARKDIIKPEVEILPNPDVPPDEEKVKESGMIGWSVIVGREIVFADGRKKHEQRKVTYKPRIRRVEVHPCRIPEGEPGHTGERCPDPGDGGVENEPASEKSSL